MRELTPVEYDRIITACTELADTHPDAEVADEFFVLSKLFIDRRVFIGTTRTKTKRKRT